jgi:hypothetical protein
MSDSIDLEFIGARLDIIRKDQADLRRRVVDLHAKFNQFEARLSSLELRFNSVEERLDHVVMRISGIETSLAEAVRMLRWLTAAEKP